MTPQSIFRQRFFTTAVLGVTCGALHVASEIYESMTGAHLDAAMNSLAEIMADDDLILRHGSRAWGAYVGLRGESAGISPGTAMSAERLRIRIGAVVNEANAPVAEESMSRGQKEFSDGKWSEEALRAYTDSILDIDISMRQGNIIEALTRQDVPPDLVPASARIVATVDMAWRTSVPDDSADFDLIIRAEDHDEDVRITRTKNLEAALDGIFASYRNMEFLLSEVTGEPSPHPREDGHGRPEF